MVQFIQRPPSFGDKMAEGIGQGASAGVQQMQQMMMQMALEKQKKNLRDQLIQNVEGGGASSNAQGQPFSEQMQKEVKQDPFKKAKQYAAAGEHELARVAMEEAKLGEKMKLEERRESHGLAKPTLERGRELLEDLPYKENALMTMKDAVSSGNLGMFSLDNLAEATGIEGLRSPEAAAFKTASKEFFLGNLSRIGSRGLNQMMERVVLEMSPLIGRSTEANLAVTEILGAENDVTRKEAELINEISQSYKQEHGSYPENLQHLVYKELRPYAQERQKEALKNIDKIKSLYAPKNKEGVLMYDPAGNLRRVPHQNRKEATQQGYRMP
jgi:hypothetical protein